MSIVADARCECGFARRYTSEARAAHALRRHSCERQRRLVEAAANGLIDEAWADRSPQPCRHKVARHEHGTHACYVLDRCRCLPCTLANSDYEADRARRHAYATFDLQWVDPEPVRTHVRALQEAGLGWKRVAAAAGVSQSVAWKLLYGKRRPDGTRTPTRRMRADLAAALLAVPAPTVDDLAGTVAVDPTGTRRRLQALTCLGWSVGRLAAEAGTDRQAFDHALAWMPVAARTARTVRDLYERLWATPAPASTHHERTASSRATHRAERAGWAPPAAWDDDDLDDPYAPDPAGYRAEECAVRGCDDTDVIARGLCSQHYHRQLRAPSKSRIAPADLDDLLHLLRAGETPARAAARVGHDLDALTAAATRHGRDDVHQLLAALAA